MSSWRQYGGTNKLNTIHSLNVNNFSSDTLTLRDGYKGNFDICGNLTVENSSTIKKDLTVYENSTIIKDLTVNGNVTIANRLTVQTINVVNQNFIINDMTVNRTLTVKGRTTLLDKIYLNRTLDRFINLISGNIGINTTTPNATFDISGNVSTVLNMYSGQITTNNILVRNANNAGITLNANATCSNINFFNETPINIGDPIAYNARIMYTQGGNIDIDTSSNIRLFSDIIIGNSSINRKDHVLNETVVIYDTSSNIISNRNALSLITQDNSSRTFLNITTPNIKGISIGGGAYFRDPELSMGTMGWLDENKEYIPSQMIVSGNNISKYRSSIGFNTYDPKKDNYVMDINGPVRITNGYLQLVSTTNYQINNLNRMRQKNKVSTIFASGYPTIYINSATGKLDANKTFIYSQNMGKTWNSFTNNISNTVINNTDITNSIFTYDNSYSLIVGYNTFNLLDLSNGIIEENYGDKSNLGFLYESGGTELGTKISNINSVFIAENDTKQIVFYSLRIIDTTTGTLVRKNKICAIDFYNIINFKSLSPASLNPESRIITDAILDSDLYHFTCIHGYKTQMYLIAQKKIYNIPIYIDKINSSYFNYNNNSLPITQRHENTYGLSTEIYSAINQYFSSYRWPIFDLSCFN